MRAGFADAMRTQMLELLRREEQRRRYIRFAAPGRQSVSGKLRLIGREIADAAVAAAHRRREQAVGVGFGEVAGFFRGRPSIALPARFGQQARIAQGKTPMMGLERPADGNALLLEIGSAVALARQPRDVA